MDKLIIRQGDVLIVQSSNCDGEALKSELSRTVLAHGEVTGHAHAFYDKSATVYQGQKTRHLMLVAPSLLKHEEHTHINIPNGKYDLPKQMEWTDDQEPIQVAD